MLWLKYKKYISRLNKINCKYLLKTLTLYLNKNINIKLTRFCLKKTIR